MSFGWEQALRAITATRAKNNVFIKYPFVFLKRYFKRSHAGGQIYLPFNHADVYRLPVVAGGDFLA